MIKNISIYYSVDALWDAKLGRIWDNCTMYINKLYCTNGPEFWAFTNHDWTIPTAVVMKPFWNGSKGPLLNSSGQWRIREKVELQSLCGIAGDVKICMDMMDRTPWEGRRIGSLLRKVLEDDTGEWSRITWILNVERDLEVLGVDCGGEKRIPNKSGNGFWNGRL